MKPNQKGRYYGRYNNNNVNRANRSQVIYRNTALESTGPCGKLRGTALQLIEKYQAAAKDALIQNDDVLAETCLQYADHYMHIQNIAISNEQNFRPQSIQGSSSVSRIENDVTESSTSMTETASENALSEEGNNKTMSSENSREVPQLSDDDLKVLDLSVPVADIAANHQGGEAEMVSQYSPRRRRGRSAQHKHIVDNNSSKE